MNLPISLPPMSMRVFQWSRGDSNRDSYPGDVASLGLDDPPQVYSSSRVGPRLSWFSLAGPCQMPSLAANTDIGHKRPPSWHDRIGRLRVHDHGPSGWILDKVAELLIITRTVSHGQLEILLVELAVTAMWAIIWSYPLQLTFIERHLRQLYRTFFACHLCLYTIRSVIWSSLLPGRTSHVCDVKFLAFVWCDSANCPFILNHIAFEKVFKRKKAMTHCTVVHQEVFQLDKVWVTVATT